MEQKRLMTIIGLCAILVILALVFISSKGSRDAGPREFTQAEIDQALLDLTPSGEESTLSPQVEKAALESLTAPSK